MNGTATCSRFEGLLLDFAYGELEGAVKRDVSTHLSGCAHCQAELAKMSSTRAAMKLLAPQEAPPNGLESLLAAAERAAKTRAGAVPKKSLLQRWLVPGAVTAFALTLVVAITGILVPTAKSPLQATSDISESVPAPVAAVEPEAQAVPEEMKPSEDLDANKDSAHASAREPSLRAKAEAPAIGSPGDLRLKSGEVSRLEPAEGAGFARKDLPAASKPMPRPATQSTDLKEAKAAMSRGLGAPAGASSYPGAPARDQVPAKAPAYRAANEFENDGLGGFGGGVANQNQVRTQNLKQKKGTGSVGRSTSDDVADKSIAQADNANSLAKYMNQSPPPPAATPQPAPVAAPREQGAVAAAETASVESRSEEPARKMRSPTEKVVVEARPPPSEVQDEERSMPRVEALVAQAKAEEGRDATGAASRYEHLQALYPQDPRAGQWLYWAGQLYERAGNLDSALAVYSRVQREYSNTVFGPKSAFQWAATNETLRRLEQAEQGYEQLPQHYPGTKEAALAQERLSSLRQQRLQRSGPAKADKRPKADDYQNQAQPAEVTPAVSK
jgi:TolA-binding protein